MITGGLGGRTGGGRSMIGGGRTMMIGGGVGGSLRIGGKMMIRGGGGGRKIGGITSNTDGGPGLYGSPGPGSVT